MNKKTFILVLLCFVWSIYLYSQGYIEVASIAEIQDNINYWNGQRVSIRGVVTIGAGVTNNTQLNVYIQDYPDDIGKGIQVYRSGPPTADHIRDLVRGNLIRVYGTIDNFTNAAGATTTEIIYDNYEVLDRGYDIPYVSLSIPEARNFQVWEGTRVFVSGTLAENPAMVGVGWNLNIQDEAGTRLTIRVWNTTNITGLEALGVGALVEVYGVVSEFNNASQIMPGYQDEITFEEQIIEYIPVDFIYLIQDNISEWNFKRVSITGIVTIGAGVTNNSQLNVYIQDYPDDSGKGIQVFRSGTPTAEHRRDFVRGNLVKINGLIEDFTNANGATTTEIHLEEYEVLSAGNDIPFVNLTLSEARNFRAWEGTRVMVGGTLSENPVIAGVGYNLNIQDTTGARLVIRVWDTTGITGLDRLQAGIPLEVYGVISEFNNASQVLPGYQDEIVIKLTHPQIENITVTPLNPHIDQEITISAEIIDHDGEVAQATLSYRLGTETTPKEIIEMNKNGNIWSATLPPYQDYDEDGEGEYIFRIIATDNEDNQTDSGEKMIVVTKRRPVITNIIMDNPAVGDSLRVRANIIDAAGGEITRAEVLYTLNYSNSINRVEMQNIGNNLYEGVLPGFSSGTMVYISIYAISDSELESVVKFDANGNEYRYIYPVISSTATLRITPKAYNVYEGDEVEILYYASAGDLVIIRLYNSEGKLVNTLLNRIQSAADGINSFIWRGRDSDFRLVEPGLYICHLEVLDRVTGKKRTDKAPIVVGTRLK